jgi:hypothetical protein
MHAVELGLQPGMLMQAITWHSYHCPFRTTSISA